MSYGFSFPTQGGTPKTNQPTADLDALREELRLTGTKKGCDQGSCGACTVHVDGRRVNACLTLALSCDGADVLTIEGLAKGQALHPVQAAFIEHDGFQCGYCTPGQIMSAVGLIMGGHAGADPERIREGMSGNLCRCGAYIGVVVMATSGNFWLALIIATLVVALLGAALQITTLRPLLGRDPLTTILATFGISLVLQNYALWQLNPAV